MPTGIVRWFDASKSHGFIVPDEGEKDVFFYINAVYRAGFSALAVGQRVEYETAAGKGGKIVVDNLVLLE